MRNLSVRAKIIIVLSLIVTVIVFFTSSYSIFLKIEELNKVIVDKSSLITDLQSKSLVRPLWDFDQEAVDSSLQSLVRDRDFSKAEVFDEKGELFSKVENKKVINENVFIQTRNIIFTSEDEEAKKIGEIKTAFTRYYTKQQLCHF